jgi:hypothetical protein
MRITQRGTGCNVAIALPVRTCLNPCMELAQTVRTRMAEYTYATVERALANVFSAADDTARTGAFRGLIQNLRRLGLPEGGPGRGTAIVYGQDDVEAWLLALQFERFGVPPAGAVKSVKGQWKRLSNFIKRARAAKHGDIVLVMETDFLSPRWTPGLDASITGFFEVRPTGIEGFLNFLGRGGCGCIFNLSARLRALDTALEAAQKAESEAP